MNHDPIAPLDLVIHGDLVLDDGSIIKDGWLGITGEAITTISQTPLHGAREIDVRHHLVLPGAVDAHVHTRSDPQEGLTAATKAAAAGGITTFIDMPFDAPRKPVRDVQALKNKIEDIEREALIDVALYATFQPKGHLDEIARLADAGACGFKVSVYGVDPERFPRIPDNQLVEAFYEIAKTHLPVAAHQENQEIVDAAIARFKEQGKTSPIYHARSRPPVSETEAASRLLEFAHWTGARLHMVHGTVPRTFDLIAWHKSTGTQATGETCIQYLTMTEEYLDKLGGRAKCNPPLRTHRDTEVLWERLESGNIDIVTSDHSPYTIDKKDTPNIFDALAGMPGVATLLPLLYSEGVAKGKITMRRLTEVLASKPADIFGLHRKGRIKPGYDADLVIFDPHVVHELDETQLHQRVNWSPYHGRQITGQVTTTILRGRTVYDNGHVPTEHPHGKFVRPTPTPNAKGAS